MVQDDANDDAAEYEVVNRWLDAIAETPYLAAKLEELLAEQRRARRAPQPAPRLDGNGNPYDPARAEQARRREEETIDRLNRERATGSGHLPLGSVREGEESPVRRRERLEREAIVAERNAQRKAA